MLKVYERYGYDPDWDERIFEKVPILKALVDEYLSDGRRDRSKDTLKRVTNQFSSVVADQQVYNGPDTFAQRAHKFSIMLQVWTMMTAQRHDQYIQVAGGGMKQFITHQGKTTLVLERKDAENKAVEVHATNLPQLERARNSEQNAPPMMLLEFADMCFGATNPSYLSEGDKEEIKAAKAKLGGSWSVTIDDTNHMRKVEKTPRKKKANKKKGEDAKDEDEESSLQDINTQRRAKSRPKYYVG